MSAMDAPVNPFLRITWAAASRMSSRVMSAPYRTVGRDIIHMRKEESRVSWQL
jgi:hypothetical protein